MRKKLVFKKEADVIIHKKNYIAPKKIVKATFQVRPAADVLGKQKRRTMSAVNKTNSRTIRSKQYRKDRRIKGKVQEATKVTMGDTMASVAMDSVGSSPGQTLESAGVSDNNTAKEMYRRRQSVKSITESKQTQAKKTELAFRGVKKGGAAILTQLEGGEEANEALHILGTAARPAEIISEKQSYHKEEKKLKIRQEDGKISSRKLKKELKQSQKKITEKQHRQAVRQRQLQYMINKLTGSGEQDSLIQTVKDIVKMKTSFVMLKAVKFMAALLAPLFGLLLTVAIPVVIIAMLFYCSPIAAFMPSPSGGPYCKGSIKWILYGIQLKIVR